MMRYLIAVPTAVAVGLVLYVLIDSDVFGSRARTESAWAPGKALVGGPFTLVDQHGKRRTSAEFRGKYPLIFFGYSHCPDVCPTGLRDMSDALDALGADAAKVQPIFISVDPGRDTPALLNAYARNFHPRLIALTGSEDAIARVAKAYRVYHAGTGEQSGDHYLVNHSTLTYLIGPDGGYLTQFSHGTPPDEVAERIRAYF